MGTNVQAYADCFIRQVGERRPLGTVYYFSECLPVLPWASAKKQHARLAVTTPARVESDSFRLRFHFGRLSLPLTPDHLLAAADPSTSYPPSRCLPARTFGCAHDTRAAAVLKGAQRSGQ